jgi:lipopolysaccharide export LptBFGC system permease protein LptF
MISRLSIMISKMIIVRFLAILVGLSLFILTLEVVTYAKEILALEQGLGIIAKYYAARAPALLATFLPMSLLLALLLTITELSYRNEITAIWALGISPLGLVAMLLPLTLLCGALHFVLCPRPHPFCVAGELQTMARRNSRSVSVTRFGSALAMTSCVLQPQALTPNALKML